MISREAALRAAHAARQKKIMLDEFMMGLARLYHPCARITPVSCAFRPKSHRKIIVNP